MAFIRLHNDHVAWKYYVLSAIYQFRNIQTASKFQLLFKKNTAMNTCVQAFVWTVFLLLLGMSRGRDLLDQLVILVLAIGM